MVHEVISCPAVPADLSAIADPRFVLLAWGSGLAFVGGYVLLARIVGRGFAWLNAGAVVLVGLAGALGEGANFGRFGLAGVLLGSVLVSRRRIAAGLFFVSGLALLVESARLGGWLPALTASLALGGVTGEMLLGHWYLVDPRLPRWALRSLGFAGIAGIALDGVMLASTGEFPGGGATAAFWVLLVTSIVLMGAVVAALRYPAYSGVMAATGLSYLAVLTTLGAVFLGRALIAGLGPFVS